MGCRRNAIFEVLWMMIIILNLSVFILCSEVQGIASQLGVESSPKLLGE